MEDRLKRILNTLDAIEIKGKSNIMMMLACMTEIEKIIEGKEE